MSRWRRRIVCMGLVMGLWAHLGLAAELILPEPPNAWKPVGSEVVLKDFATGEVIPADRLIRDAYLGMPVRHCLYGFPGWRCGIKAGDIIVGISDQRVADPREFNVVFGQIRRDGSDTRSANVMILRQGRLGSCTLVLQRRERPGILYVPQADRWVALMKKAGQTVPPEDLPIVDYMPGRFIAIAERWAAANPQSLPSAAWLGDMHRFFVALCRQEFKTARRPSVAVPFPFGAYLADFYDRLARHMAADGAPLDVKAMSVSAEHFSAYYPLPWFQESILPMGKVVLNYPGWYDMFLARLNDPAGSATKRRLALWDRGGVSLNLTTEKGLNEINLQWLVSPTFAVRAENDYAVTHRADPSLREKNRELLTWSDARVGQPDLVLRYMMMIRITEEESDVIQLFENLFKLSPQCAQIFFRERMWFHDIYDMSVNARLAPIMMGAVMDGSPFYRAMIQYAPSCVVCLDYFAPCDAVGGDAHALCRYLTEHPVNIISASIKANEQKVVTP